MKNLMVYLNPTREFDYESAKYVEIQIDNSLKYWNPEDIILVTNFPYEYNGISARVVSDKMIFDFDAKACKVNVIVDLLEKGILTELTWYHDLEAFQNQPIDVTIKHDLGLTDYGWKPKWNTGSFFFKPQALDIFRMLQKEVVLRRANEEPVFWILYKNNVDDIQARCEKLNITYNVGKRYGQMAFPKIDKPVRVLHFHLYRRPDRFQRLKPLMSKTLLEILSEKYPYRKN